MIKYVEKFMEKTMIIGVDCDGVLTDMSAYIYEYGEKYFKRKPSNLDGYSASEIFNCSNKDEFKFGFRYFFKYCKKCPPRNRAVEIISNLNNDGHKLYEITARKFVTMHNLLGWYCRFLYEQWLKKHGFVFNGIHYCSENNSPEDKLEGCRKFDVDLMIDDKPDVALYLANNGIKILLFDTRYNQNINHENIIRVYDWDEIYIKINEIKRKCVK